VWQQVCIYKPGMCGCRKKGCKRAASVRFCVTVDGARTCLRLLLLQEDAELASYARALLPQVCSRSARRRLLGKCAVHHM
jgi:hypothetical protein